MSINTPLKVHITAQAEAYLTPTLREALPNVNEMVARKSRELGIAVREVEVGVDYDEGWSNLTYAVHAPAEPQRGKELWAAIVAEIERWAKTLPTEQADEISQDLLFYVVSE